MKTTNFEELLPNKVLFSIEEIEDLGIIKSDMCKKLIYRKELETIKIGSKNHCSRSEIIRYLQSRIIPPINQNQLLKSA